MGHALHFLKRLERINAAQADYALTLYRDRPAILYILQRLRLPDEADRIAFSIDAHDDGPFIIVARDGNFITCLARGMSPGKMPVIPFGQFSALYREQLQGRERLEQARRLAGRQTLQRLATRLFSRGNWVSREEFSAIAALQPVVQTCFFRTSLQWAARLEEMRNRIVVLGRRSARLPSALHSYWSGYHALVHMMSLVAMNGKLGLEEWLRGCRQERDGMKAEDAQLISWVLAREGETALTARAAWCMARIGKPVLAAAKTLFRDAEQPEQFCEAVAILTAISLRHRSTRTEIRKTFASYAGPSDEIRDMLDGAGGLVRSVFRHVMIDPAGTYEPALRYVRNVTHATLKPYSLPPPFDYPEPEDIPEDIAWPFAASLSYDLWDSASAAIHLMMLVPWLGRCAAEDLYLPADLIRHLQVPWQPEHSLRLVEHWRRRFKVAPVQHEEPQPGRNSPCPCGSGKKYKHCCLRKQADDPQS